MHFRSYSWGAANLSWSVVIEELLHAVENKGHLVHFLSTNGTDGMRYWDEKRHLASVEAERKMRNSGIPYDVDLTFTVPENFHKRFLKTSKVKMAIYDYESRDMPARWQKDYALVDFVLPASKYVADMFLRNGCPEEKIKIVHHGIDLEIFNPDVPPLSLATNKKFKFLCIAAPHYRKQLDRLLDVYCKKFTSADDVVLVLKTKLFKPGEKLAGYEMDLVPKILKLKSQYGSKIPEIKILTSRINNIASLYTACNAFVLMTASEGWGIPFLESLACNIPVIAPRHGGQLDFLNDNNALLCSTGTRLARPQEQYWGSTPGSTVGNPNEEEFGALMRLMYENYTEIKSKLVVGMTETATKMTWKSAADKIIDIAKSTGRIES